MEIRQITADPDTTPPDAVEALPEETLYEPDQFTCNAYLALGERTTLVDAGTLPGIARTVERLVDGLDAVVVTHGHGDHVAELDAVLEAFDPDCYAYADLPGRTHAVGDGDEVPIGDGTFEAIYTPGHADDHLAFVGETVLFSGDVVVPNDEAFDDGSFGSAPPGPARERLIESLETLLERLPAGVEHLYAGHGVPHHGDVRDVIETALERAERREPKYD